MTDETKSKDVATPKTVKKQPKAATYDDSVLLAKIENLEKCLAKMAHYTGGSCTNVIREFGLTPYILTQTDMGKKRG